MQEFYTFEDENGKITKYPITYWKAKDLEPCNENLVEQNIEYILNHLDEKYKEKRR